MNENTVWASFWFCAAAVLSVAAFQVGGYQIERLQLMERMVKDYNVSPMLFKCTNMNLSKLYNFELCKIVVEKNKLSDSDMKKLKTLIQKVEK